MSNSRKLNNFHLMQQIEFFVSYIGRCVASHACVSNHTQMRRQITNDVIDWGKWSIDELSNLVPSSWNVSGLYEQAWVGWKINWPISDGVEDVGSIESCEYDPYILRPILVIIIYQSKTFALQWLGVDWKFLGQNDLQKRLLKEQLEWSLHSTNRCKTRMNAMTWLSFFFQGTSLTYSRKNSLTNSNWDFSEVAKSSTF